MGSRSQWRGRVLLVDDDVQVLRLLERLMGEDGFDVRTARCGADALKLALTDEFGVVVCDEHMPAMTGLELARELERLRPSLASRILLVSGAPPDPQDGVSRFRWLSKPLDLETLYVALAELAAR